MCVCVFIPASFLIYAKSIPNKFEHINQLLLLEEIEKKENNNTAMCSSLCTYGKRNFWLAPQWMLKLAKTHSFSHFTVKKKKSKWKCCNFNICTHQFVEFGYVSWFYLCNSLQLAVYFLASTPAKWLTSREWTSLNVPLSPTCYKRISLESKVLNIWRFS